MEHPEEHILELVAAGSRVSDVIDRQVRDHLAVCPHCAATVEEMRAFYADVAAEYAEIRTRDAAEPDTHADAGLPATRRQIARRPADTPAPGPLVREVRWFVSDHPVFSAGIAAGLLGLLGLALFVPSHDTIAVEPSYTRLDPVAGTVETYDAADRRLWSKPVYRIEDMQNAQRYNRPMTAVVDLNRDGSNEVVIGFNLGRPEDGIVERVASVFTAEGTLIGKIREGRASHFGRERYRDDFGVSGLIALKEEPAPVLAIAWAHYHSPSILSLVGADLRATGRYWHYGHLFAPTAIPDPGGSGRSMIACLGVNQASDSAGIQFPVLLVLDPSRITGDTESGTTRGFGLPVTAAEIACIRFPEPDVVMKHSSQYGAKRIHILPDGTVKVLVGETAWTLEYIFTPDLRLLQVKPTQGFDRTHEALRREGKVRSVYGPAYLEELKLDLLYWNGTAWQREPVLIGRPPS